MSLDASYLGDRAEGGCRNVREPGYYPVMNGVGTWLDRRGVLGAGAQ
jgi:hypothetical protein